MSPKSYTPQEIKNPLCFFDQLIIVGFRKNRNGNHWVLFQKFSRLFQGSLNLEKRCLVAYYEVLK